MIILSYNEIMNEDHNALYKAFATHDPRFDGTFFVGVVTTGIYCRPICTARLPKQINCRFFKTAAAAEKELFRPCLRCRPELAPGNAPVDNAQRIANLLNNADEVTGVEEVATQCRLSARQMRRIIQKEFGVSPIELILTRRLLLAKQLLTDTVLPIIDIAFASGFSSLRRFNDAFKKHYRMAPSHFRKLESRQIRLSDQITLYLSYRPPYAWESILSFLKDRVLVGIESVSEGAYSRTVQINEHKGWVIISHDPNKKALKCDISLSLVPVLSILLPKLRCLFDLNARPDHIVERLGQDPLLKDAVKANPGLRVPGAFDSFELSVRAILGQQVTVKAATTIACRFVKAFGEPWVTPIKELTHLSPLPETIAGLTSEKIAEQGIIRTRAQSILRLAQEISSGRLPLENSVDPEATMHLLTQIPGIGKWTAHYIAMRALHWPDAFPKEDVALRKRLGSVTPKQAEEMSLKWRPWRSYALLHIWAKSN